MRPYGSRSLFKQVEGEVRLGGGATVMSEDKDTVKVSSYLQLPLTHYWIHFPSHKSFTHYQQFYRQNKFFEKTSRGWDKTTVGGQAKDNWDWLALAAIMLCGKKNKKIIQHRNSIVSAFFMPRLKMRYVKLRLSMET